MKTPDSRREFHTPSRHYHRHRVEHPDPWNTWVGREKRASKSRRRKWRIATWFAAIFGFVGLIALVCYELF